MSYKKRKKAILLLADGTRFYGKSVVCSGSSYGEICFNTGMTGYQEIFTDPSYHGQLMVTTNSHIGNYGVQNLEAQSEKVKISGLICKNFSYEFSRPGATSLYQYLKTNQIITISDIDTRAVVNYIRENGAMNAVITTQTNSIDKIEKQLSKYPKMQGLELASKVSTNKPYLIGNPNSKYKVAVLDLGIKNNILNNLINKGFNINVYPYDTYFSEIQKWNPDGYFISNGPGDPEPLIKVQKLAKLVIENDIPLFGICLGHQIIALANGIKTYKMFNGHRGINHPVINLITGKGEITSQNHGFAVDKASAESNPDFLISHLHLNDDTVAGLQMKNKNCFSVQYHPEAGPGPNDTLYLFDQFYENIKKIKS